MKSIIDIATALKAEDDRWCNCIALHDFDGDKVQWQAWLEFIVSVFAKHNLVPNKLGVGGEHYGDSVKPMSFRGGYKKLQKFNFEKIKKLSIFFIAAKDHYMSNFLIDANIYPNWNNSKHSFLSLCIDEQLEPFNLTQFNEFAIKLHSFTNAKYGYYFRRHLRHWPDSYPMSVQPSRCYSEEDAYYNRIWRRHAFDYAIGGKYIGGLYQTGKLRDIYRINFLSQEHLQWKLANGQTLQAWIESNVRYGKITQLNENLWSWYIDSDKISLVKEELTNVDEDIIICNRIRLAAEKLEYPDITREGRFPLIYPIDTPQ